MPWADLLGGSPPHMQLISAKIVCRIASLACGMSLVTQGRAKVAPASARSASRCSSVASALSLARQQPRAGELRKRALTSSRRHQNPPRDTERGYRARFASAPSRPLGKQHRVARADTLVPAETSPRARVRDVLRCSAKRLLPPPSTPYSLRGFMLVSLA